MKNIIEVKKLNKEYRVHKKEISISGSIKSLFKRKYMYTKAVMDISFKIKEGEFIGYIGPNGAGKTTTLKMLSGLIHPTSGEALVLDLIPWKRCNEFKKNISFVMGQKNQLWWDIPAMETFLLNKEIYKIDKNQFDERIKYLTSLLSVEDLIDIPVRNLSLGERMKLELINSLLHYPKVLFLDEPTIGLDVISQNNIRNFLKRYNKENKTTIMLTSHYMKDVEELCKRIILIDKGKIVYDGNLAYLIQKYSQEKTINVRFSNNIPKWTKNLSNISIKDQMNISFKLKKDEIPEISKKLLNGNNVEDISISENSLEEIIKIIFSDRKNA